MERTIIQVGPLGPLGTWKDLILTHGNCSGGRLQWEARVSEPYCTPDTLCCTSCGQMIIIVDRAALVRTGRTGQQFDSLDLDLTRPAACPQRYEPIAQQLFEQACLEEEVKVLRQKNEQLKSAIREAIVGLKKSRAFAKSQFLRDIREKLEAVVEE